MEPLVQLNWSLQKPNNVYMSIAWIASASSWFAAYRYVRTDNSNKTKEEPLQSHLGLYHRPWLNFLFKMLTFLSYVDESRGVQGYKILGSMKLAMCAATLPLPL